jgi:PAS domain S-box-containing protein
MTKRTDLPQPRLSANAVDAPAPARLAADQVRLLFADAPDAVLATDERGRIVAVNPAAVSLLGRSEDDLLGRPVSGLIVDQSADAKPASPARFIADERWHDALRLRRGDDSVVRIAAWFTPLSTSGAGGGLLILRREHVDATGETHAARSSRAAQITAQDANRALHESEERFRGAFDGAPIGMALVARDGRFLQVNRALCGILGYGEAELLAKSFPEITAPADRDADRELVRQLLADEIDTYQIEKGYLRRDGQTICGRLTVSLVRDAAGEPGYFVAQMQDITPYKAAGRALREAEARYRALVEQIPAVVYVDRPDALGLSIYVSPRVETLLGFTAAEWLAKADGWLDHVHPDDRERVLAATAEANEAGSPTHLEYRFLARDGREVWVHDEGELIRDEDGARQYWQGFIFDITERKLAEEELRAAKESAEEASRLKSAFLSMATHELRTPLTIISGYVELLAASTAKYTAEEREFLDITRTSIQTLTSLVNDLLDLARIEAGRMELEITAVDVAEAIERVRRMVAAQAAAKGIGLHVALAPDLPPVAADPDRLVQILLNLVGNAVKFTESGGVTVTARALGDGVEFAVADTGIGIPPEVLPRIFDEFRQADVGTTRKYGGSGLGLAIARRLVEMHAGTIAVVSDVGAGTTFTVWLPAGHARRAANRAAGGLVMVPGTA